MVERYINPHTDFGFKRLFGSEFNKELLISFLNALFRGEQNVKDVTYLNSEQLGDRIDARRAVFYSMIYDNLTKGINLIQMQIYAGKNHHYARQGKNMPTVIKN